MDKCCFAFFGKKNHEEEEEAVVHPVINFAFPHLSEYIFGFLNDLDLVQCRSVSKTWRVICGDLLYKRWKNQMLEPFSRGNVRIVKLLLEYITPPEIKKGEFEFTPLMVACKNGQTKVVKLLLDHPDIDINARDNTGKTAFMWACRQGKWETARLLLLVCDNFARDNFGETAFMMACQYGQVEVVHGLIHQPKYYLDQKDI